MPTQIPLKQLLLERFTVRPTPQQSNTLLRYVKLYELRDDNPLAFNSPLLGVKLAYFFPKDATGLFDVFNVSQSDFAQTIKQCSSINDRFHVASNDFNMFCIWMSYMYIKSNLSSSMKQQCVKALLMMLHYKFFTGRVLTHFPHGAREDVMKATIDGLSAKCDIKNEATSTWALVMQSHVEQAIASNSIHYRTFNNFEPDKAVVYILSDLHTRLASKIMIVAQAYYENYEKGIGIDETTAVGENPDGEKELKAMRAGLDNAINQIVTQVPNHNAFINNQDIQLCSNLCKDIRPDMLRDVLMTFSNVATVQYRAHEVDKVVEDKKNNTRRYEGYRILVSELIQKTYRRCALNGVNMQSNVEILNATQAIYRASRILDPDILNIKSSVDWFVHENTKYTRDATLVSLRVAMILYLIVQSFKYR